MKLLVVGLGQAGNRIADEFVNLNRIAHANRGIEIVPGALAVNTDAADLSGLKYIKPDYNYRILIGGSKTNGHGVGKINELGAEVAMSDGDKIIEAIRNVKRFFPVDAFMLVAAAGGGTGSGSIAIITKMVKERWPDLPVYDTVVLPFEHEQETEERTIYNCATCLKAVYSVADAIFLVDNQRYVAKDLSLMNNLSKINSMIVSPFYNVLCAGEEKKRKFIGAKTLDAGDIMATISGWSVIGYGQSEIGRVRIPFNENKNFISKSVETHKGVQAMDSAIGDLSVGCNPADAGRALYLVTAPVRDMDMNMIKELGNYLRNLCPQATIRSGDYPRENSSLEVTVILSELKQVEKVKEYFDRALKYIPEVKRRREAISDSLKGMEDSSKDIPSLFKKPQAGQV
jgi:tubulin-like protein CetZ